MRNHQRNPKSWLTCTRHQSFLTSAFINYGVLYALKWSLVNLGGFAWVRLAFRICHSAIKIGELFLPSIRKSKQTKMRNHTYLKLFILCCFYGCTLGLSAQNGIGLFSRHLLNPNGEVAIGIPDRNAFAFLGSGIEYRRDKEEHKLYSFIIGFSLQEDKGPRFSTPPGVFLQANWKIFKPLIDKEKLNGNFSLGPRLFYLTRTSEPADGSSDLPIKVSRYGFEVQAAFNLDYELNSNFTLTGFINCISAAFSLVNQEVVNPILTPAQRKDSRGTAFDLDGRIFNELRLGLMYSLGK